MKIAAFGVLAKSTKPRLPTHSLHPAWYQAKLIELSLYSSICARKKTEELRNKGEGGTEVGGMNSTQLVTAVSRGGDLDCWAEAPIKIARMILTIKLDGNWSSFQLANSAPPLSVTIVLLPLPQASLRLDPPGNHLQNQSFLWSKNKMKRTGSNHLYNPRTSIVTRVGCAATGLVLCQRNT